MCDTGKIVNTLEMNGECELDEEFTPDEVARRSLINEKVIAELRRRGKIPLRDEVVAYFGNPKKVERLVLLLWDEGIWRDRLPIGIGETLRRIPRAERVGGWDLASYVQEGERVWVLFLMTEKNMTENSGENS